MFSSNTKLILLTKTTAINITASIAIQPVIIPEIAPYDKWRDFFLLSGFTSKLWLSCVGCEMTAVLGDSLGQISFPTVPYRNIKKKNIIVPQWLIIRRRDLVSIDFDGILVKEIFIYGPLIHTMQSQKLWVHSVEKLSELKKKTKRAHKRLYETQKFQRRNQGLTLDKTQGEW